MTRAKSLRPKPVVLVAAEEALEIKEVAREMAVKKSAGKKVALNLDRVIAEQKIAVLRAGGRRIVEMPHASTTTAGATTAGATTAGAMTVDARAAGRKTAGTTLAVQTTEDTTTGVAPIDAT